MKNTDYQELVLNCASWQEAQDIADQLLKKRLVSTVEFVEVQSHSWRTSASKEIRQIKLIMQSLANDVQVIEAELAELYGHTNFALQHHSPAIVPTTKA